jgi:hypothetical protein
MTAQIRHLNLCDAEKQALKTHDQATTKRHWQERMQWVLLKGQG